ncbi:MAG: hypothetical protein GX552_08320 [Chloroflexi bacterium]|nr:hypothetical protein [Chloroflexota bacterium]
MQTIEQRLARLCERLAQENRRLLALLVLGYTLPQAERLLREEAGPARGSRAERRGAVTAAPSGRGLTSARRCFSPLNGVGRAAR